MIHDIAVSRELAWRLLVRNLSSRYRHTAFGYVWAFLPPILSTAVFVFLRQSGYFTVAQTPVPYAVFLFAGLILWQVFCDAIAMPLRMVQQSHAILTKVNFPREALVIAGIGEVLFGFVIRFALLLIGLWWFKVGISPSMLWVPFGVAVLIGLGVGLGLLLTPIGILYHDVGHGLPFVLYLWMFLTPVLYPAPQSWAASSAWALNPVGPLLDTTRAWLLSVPPEHLAGFQAAAALAAFTLLIGWLLYRLALPILLERMSA
jgi:lipopolysaccharide transport system permease protein